jgi:uncharacterized membrane protein
MFKTLKRELGAWREWLKVAGLILLIIGGVALIVFFWVFLLGMVAVFMAGAVVAWALGMKITVKKKDKVIGYLRWFTFHTLEQ